MSSRDIGAKHLCVKGRDIDEGARARSYAQGHPHIYRPRRTPGRVLKEGITEQLKAQNQMAWVGAMNNIRNRAEEIVLHEMIVD